MNVNPIELLLVEDSEPDVRLTMEALREAKVKNRLWVVEDGVEAMASCGSKTATPTPRART